MTCKYCIDSLVNRKYREAGFGFNLDWLIENVCSCEPDPQAADKTDSKE